MAVVLARRRPHSPLLPGMGSGAVVFWPRRKPLLGQGAQHAGVQTPGAEAEARQGQRVAPPGWTHVVAGWAPDGAELRGLVRQLPSG